MAKAIPILALLLAYLITILYLAAMCVPWWFTHYYAVGQSNSDFQNNNPGLLRNTGLFSRSNCFIDGSCITGHVIYKNNSNLQWVYTTVLVLMIVGWLPWLLFVHLLHFRSNKNRSENAGKRILLALTALLTMAFLVSAVIVFACGMVYNNRIYRHGLYGDRAVLTAANGLTTIGQHVDDNNNNNNNNANNANGDNVNKRQESPSGILQSISNIVGSASGSVAATFPSSPGTAATQTVVATSSPSSAANTNFNTNADAAINFEDENSFGNNLGAFTYGTMPWGGSDTQVLGAGIPVLYSIAGISPNTIGNNNKRQITNNDGLSNAYYFPTPYTGAINGTLGYKWGAHAGWYLTILALALIPLVLLLSLLIKTKGKVVTKSRHVERVVTSQPAVVPPQYAQGPAVLPQQPFVPVGNRAL